MLHDNSVDNAENRLKSIVRMLEHAHLDEGWNYDIKIENKDIIITEVPDNEEMLEGLPGRIEVQVNIPEKYMYLKNMDNIIKYGNDRQIDIELELSELKRYAGDRLIERRKSTEENPLVMTIPPKPFPIIKTIFKFTDSPLQLNLWLQILQKIDDKIMEIGNKNDPNKLIEYRFTFNLNTNEKSDLHITVPADQRGNIQSLITFEKMMYYASLNSELEIYVDSEEEIYSEEPIFTTSFGTDNQEGESEARLQLIQLYEDIISIEHAFNVKFEIPSGITPNERGLISKLIKVIKDGEITREISNEMELVVQFHKPEILKDVIEETKSNKGSIIRNEINENCVLFDKELDIGKVELYTPPALIKNVESAEEKSKVFEEGDLINIVLIPKEENSHATIVYKKFN